MFYTYLRKIKNKIIRMLLSYPRKVECNLCGWQGRHLISDNWHPHTICPQCSSQVRHRLLAAAIYRPGLKELAHLTDGKAVLHFAPEAVLRNLVASAATEYRTADFLRPDVDLQVDMCNMSAIADGAFEVVIACDVLEHVPDDGQALDELARILKPGGWAILTVPQKDGLATTYEDPEITTEKGRLDAFGQEDHLRIYGDDFSALLERHGFSVTTVNERSFSDNLVNRHVLFPPLLSKHPLATNYRKVFFAQKSLVA